MKKKVKNYVKQKLEVKRIARLEKSRQVELVPVQDIIPPVTPSNEQIIKSNKSKLNYLTKAQIINNN